MELSIRGPALAVDIINVDIASEFVESEIGSNTSLRHASSISVEVLLAFIGLESSIGGIIIESVPVGHLSIGDSAVYTPVGASIAHHESLQVQLNSGGRSLLVVLINLPGSIGHINPSITFPRNVEVVGLEFWEESCEEVEDGIEVVYRRGDVIEDALTPFDVASGISHSAWTLNIEHVVLLVPRVLVVMEGGLSVFNGVGTVLLSEPQHGGASWPSVEPDYNGISRRIRLRLSEHIVEFLSGGGASTEVARGEVE